MTMFQIIRLVRRERVQIINVHYATSGFLYFALCRWLLAVKLVISVHGADFFPGGQKLTRYRWGLRLLLSSSDAIVAPSKAYLEDFLSLFPHLRERGTFIHNGLDLEEVAQEANGRNPDQGKYLLCVATHNQKKGLDVLLKTFALLRETSRTLKLLLVGDGPLRGQYEGLARELGIEDRVEFLGQREHSETVRLLRGCEIFVLPSKSEPFGVVIIEAMACQKPVVASAVGGIPEIIENGKNGILVESNNPRALAQAIRSLLEDESLRRLIAANGYTRVVEHFRYENTGTQYEILFSELLGGSFMNQRFCIPGEIRQNG
jgi:glycosyltransferase involved in cell wall biosynthesis